MSYLDHLRTVAPKPNTSGRFVVTPETRARRFLVLGNEGGTYYASERKLTQDNAKAVVEWAVANPLAASEEVILTLTDARAPKVAPALLSAALLSVDPRTRDAMLPLIHRLPTGSHLLTFVSNYKALGGKWGRKARREIGRWYTSRNQNDLSYQLLKYQNREGFTQGDVLRLTHPIPVPFTNQAELFAWATGHAEPKPSGELFEGYQEAKVAKTAMEVAGLVRHYRLTREMIPSQWLNEPEVIVALLESSPATAMLRNLASYTRAGGITDRGTGGQLVVDRLTSPGYMAKSKIHPMNVLTAWRTYASGHGLKSSATWTPVRRVVDALEEAFYLSFKTLPEIGRATMIGVDVSGSMMSGIGAVPGMSVAEAAGAMAMALVRAGKPGHVACFGVNDKIQPLPITQETKLGEALSMIQRMGGGTTDLSAPTELARKVHRSLPSEVERPQGFLMITDNATNSHRVNPAESLRRYRQETGIENAASVIMAMTADEISIADPGDPFSVDIAGFDHTAAPLIQEFLG